MTAYYYYIFLAILLLAVGIISHQRGFWTAIVYCVAAFLSTVITLRFLLPFAEVLRGMGAGSYSEAAALLILFLIVLMILSLLSRVKKISAFFPKNVNLAATVFLVLILGGGGWLGIAKLTEMGVIGVSSEAPPAAMPAEDGAAAAEPAPGEEPAPEATEAPASPLLAIDKNLLDRCAVSVPELLALTILFLFWSWTGSWIAGDAAAVGVKTPIVWNAISGTLFPIAFCAALFLMIPWFGLLIPAAAWLIPSLSYVGVRNSGLAQEEKVMTPSHIKDVVVRLITRKKKQHRETGWALPIELSGWGKDVPKAERRKRAEALKAQSGCMLLSELVYSALKRKAVSFKISTDGDVAVEFFIDGFWHPMHDVFRRTLSAEEALHLTSAMKTIIGGNVEETRARQTGQFYIEYDKKQGKAKKKAATLIIQGKGNGEEALVQIEYLHLRFGTLERLGMSPQRVEQMEKLLKTDKGLIVFSAPPGHGLKTLTNIALTVSDRFTRDFVTIEDVQKPYWTIENIQLNTYDSSKGETPMKILPDVLFREPRVLVLRDVVNVEAFSTICRESQNDRLIYTTFRGRDSADTIIRMLKTGIDPKLLADSLTAVVTQRLVRILCPACKEEIPANPEILRKLGISPSFVSCLYRKRARPPVEAGQKINYVPCAECLEIGYKKRSGIYDIITVTDELRQVIVSNPTEEAIRRAAAKSGERGFLTDGARLVAWGATSFEELVRALK